MWSSRIQIDIRDWLLPLMVGVGLFFINIKPYHDWGDDFAQYLQQAENLAKGELLSKSSYQFNPSFSRIGPQVYPPGFSWFLSFFHSVDAVTHLQNAQLLISFFGLIFTLFAYHLFQYFGLSKVWSIVLTVLLVYHPYFIHQKSEILSDIPFAALFLGATYLFAIARKWWVFCLAALLAGLAISTRSIGLVMPLAALILLVVSNQQRQNHLLGTLLFVLCGLCFGIGLNYVLGYYELSQNGYTLLFSSPVGFWAILNFNFAQYLDTFERLLIPEQNPHIHIFLVILQKVVIGALFIGSFLQLRQKLNFINILVLLYLGVLMIYPYTGGYRFLIPLLPFFIYWIRTGLLILSLKKSVHQNLLAGLTCLLLLISYVPQLSTLKQREKQAFPGPQLPEAHALYAWLETIPDDQTVLFGKPRALAYYTKQRTLATEPEAHMESFANDLRNFQVQYLIKSIDVYYPTLDRYLEKHDYPIAYQNFRFTVYEVPKL